MGCGNQPISNSEPRTLSYLKQTFHFCLLCHYFFSRSRYNQLRMKQKNVPEEQNFWKILIPAKDTTAQKVVRFMECKPTNPSLYRFRPVAPTLIFLLGLLSAYILWGVADMGTTLGSSEGLVPGWKIIPTIIPSFLMSWAITLQILMVHQWLESRKGNKKENGN